MMMRVQITDRDEIAAVWQIELGWDRARCDAEFASQRWSNFLEWGEQIWWRDGDEHPCINMFTGRFGTPVGWVDIHTDRESLRVHTSYKDDPS